MDDDIILWTETAFYQLLSTIWYFCPFSLRSDDAVTIPTIAIVQISI
jgi:hypothetical protein